MHKHRNTFYYSGLTFASMLSVRPLLNLNHISRPTNEILILICGVHWDVIWVPSLGQIKLSTCFGDLFNLEKHATLKQVDVFKEPIERMTMLGTSFRNRLTVTTSSV